MVCETCGKRMGKIAGAGIFWCRRCGSWSTAEGRQKAPDLVGRCRLYEEKHVRTAVRAAWWVHTGVAEAIHRTDFPAG